MGELMTAFGAQASSYMTEIANVALKNIRSSSCVRLITPKLAKLMSDADLVGPASIPLP